MRSLKDEINLYDLWILIKKNFVKLLTCMFIGLGVAGLVTFFVITPQYSSQTQLIAQLPKDSQEAGNGVNNNLMMINTYKDLVKSNLVIDASVDELNSKYHYDLTTTSLNKMISVSQEQNSQMFTIKAVADSPQEAQNVANVVATVFQNKALKVMKVDKISITSKAMLNNKPVSPNNLLNLLIGIILGLVVGFIIIFIGNLRDTTIKDEDWISDNLGITVLGAIPEMNSKELSVRVKQVDGSGNEATQNNEAPLNQNENSINDQQQRRQRHRV